MLRDEFQLVKEGSLIIFKARKNYIGKRTAIFNKASLSFERF
jgi:hypothetical protein